jgi:group I intron endonuclease
MSYCGIYEIRNVVTNDAYVGSTINRDNRWLEHRCELNGNYHHNQHLQNAWNKYGERSFLFNWLEDTPQDLLLMREQAYLDSGVFVYNIAKHADAPTRGRAMSEISRHRLSESRRGIKFSEEHRRKLSEAAKGKKLSEATRHKMSESRKGHPTSEETRRKISNSHKGKKGTSPSEATRRKMSESQKGKFVSEDTCRKISEALKRRSLSAEHKTKLSEAKSKVND